ncbi:MAG: hypothetical protein H6810_08800 [Phycisphaeraceae bacterium]|nr:MAG: hypothetical protein H6810_08800 [Phycisphaeraceae bacterium]
MNGTSRMRAPIACVALAAAAVASTDASGQPLSFDPPLPELGGFPGEYPLPPLVIPDENPITEPKRVLGKILFWDEQLSTDNTRACGSCHVSSAGGTDPVLAPNPGPDGEYGTEDDKYTSFGVIHTGADGRYIPDPVFGLDRQAGFRSAPPSIFAAYFTELFWDGRAIAEFVDPETGEVAIPNNAALESQAVQPIFNPAEMAHDGRAWVDVKAKLVDAVPLALAQGVPDDAAAVLADHPSYPDLFAAAFGDSEITGRRVAMAIATYERTLIPDQTPFDLYVAGDTGAMTPGQILGWERFNAVACVVCHTPPLFVDRNFQSVGLRPDAEDLGHGGVTGNPGDAGTFKTSTLRNVGLKASFMHTGALTTMEEVFDFYAGAGADGVANRNPFLPIDVTPDDRASITDFMVNALTDPRVAAEAFPFDRPSLYSEWGDNPRIEPGGTAGSGGITPRVIAISPPNVGNLDFKVGLADALGGATANVAVSDQAPVGGVVSPDELVGPFLLPGAAPGEGYATWQRPIPARPALEGSVLYMQWRVDDPAAADGLALSPPVRVEFFCNGRCASTCPADVAEPFDVLDLADVQSFVLSFVSGDALADLAAPFGVLDLADVQLFVSSFLAGCP